MVENTIKALADQLEAVRKEHRLATEQEGGEVVFEGFSNDSGLFIFVTRTLWHGTEDIDPALAQKIRNGDAFIDDHPDYFIEIDTWRSDGEQFIHDPEMVHKINSPDNRVHEDSLTFFSALRTHLQNQACAEPEVPSGP